MINKDNKNLDSFLISGADDSSRNIAHFDMFDSVVIQDIEKITNGTDLYNDIFDELNDLLDYVVDDSLTERKCELLNKKDKLMSDLDLLKMKKKVLQSQLTEKNLELEKKKKLEIIIRDHDLDKNEDKIKQAMDKVKSYRMLTGIQFEICSETHLSGFVYNQSTKQPHEFIIDLKRNDEDICYDLWSAMESTSD